MHDKPDFPRRRAGVALALIAMIAAVPDERRPLIGSVSIHFDHQRPEVSAEWAPLWRAATAAVAQLMRS